MGSTTKCLLYSPLLTALTHKLHPGTRAFLALRSIAGMRADAANNKAAAPSHVVRAAHGARSAVLHARSLPVSTSYVQEGHMPLRHTLYRRLLPTTALPELLHTLHCIYAFTLLPYPFPAFSHHSLPTLLPFLPTG